MSKPIDQLTRVQSAGGVVDQTWVWVELHWLELMAGLPAILLTIGLVEICKGWIKLWMTIRLGDRYTDAIENLVIRTFAVPCSALWVGVLDFTGAWNAMTNSSLDWWQGMLVGTTLNTTLVILVVWAVDYFELAKTARAKFRASPFGVTDQRLDAALTSSRSPPVTPEQIAVDRKRKGLD